MARNATAPRRQNDQREQPADILAAAIAAEDQIAAAAAEIRGDATELTPALLVKLMPLLRKPIHRGFIKTVGNVTGKPYESTGVSSVQVQIERMDNVLTPLWWREDLEYMQDGKLCYVTVFVGNLGEDPMVRRSSMGGVDRGSTIGNIYKGSYTNAAKVAFARVGPGHEVYLGAVDLDPDVHEQTAKQQGQTAKQQGQAGQSTDAGKFDGDSKITRTLAQEIVAGIWTWELQQQLPLALAHVTGEDPGDLSTQTKAVAVVQTLTISQATRVKAWIDKKAAEKQAAADNPQTELPTEPSND